ncbi:protein phosphatase 1 regulatory subunit 32 [Rhinatrema bivittatum]|uniref:protein phosphatase 1 regulatory subunit 32 n=1 Tax=Rhinatrema bivittatum TaxID=194408 RepID=UPI00112E8EA5|nr:protein phosphatase 1 regulatory subunit 32 [Rhinatrema bivittatum]XP_029438726.1 protein phosphatase 1 regulatory subunit 32 [Rhinatrema bivittatum]
MGRLPMGCVSPHVKTSSGGKINPLRFYSTTYCSSYGQEGFKPRDASCSGTGYQSNLRPLVCYDASLDKLDNPAMGLLLRDSHLSVAGQHFMPLEVPNGTEILPTRLYQTGSGFRKGTTITLPYSRVVKNVHFDTQDHGPEAIVGLPPKYQPLLFQPRDKGSEEQENFRYGPHSLSTDYKTKFKMDPPILSGFLEGKSVGALEDTGFTEGSNLEPITYLPPSQYRQDIPISPIHRLTGASITRTDFLPCVGPSGSESMPSVVWNAEHDSGFCQDIDKRIIYAEKPGARVHRSEMHDEFEGLQRERRSHLGLLDRVHVGDKYLTGYSANNKPLHVTPARLPQGSDHCLTSYNFWFYNKNPLGIDREGWTRSGIQKRGSSSFSVNNSTHKLNIPINAVETLRNVHPHVGRAIKEVDLFYDDKRDKII